MKRTIELKDISGHTDIQNEWTVEGDTIAERVATVEKIISDEWSDAVEINYLVMTGEVHFECPSLGEGTIVFSVTHKADGDEKPVI